VSPVCQRIVQAVLSPAPTEIRRDGALSFMALSAECRVLVRQAQAISFAGGVHQPDIECANRSLPNFLATDGRNPRSPTSSSMALVGSGRLRLLPFAATVGPKFLPLGYAHSSRKQETPVCTVLHCVAALRVQQSKPLPETSHRGRE
jgi:hypothetical protein